MHVPLVLDAGTTAARHALVLDDLAIKVVLGLDNAAKEHPAAYASVGRRRSRERRNNRVIGGCLLVYFGHGRQRHRPRRGDGQPQGSRPAIQSLIRSESMIDGENYRDLLTCLSTALAMIEAAFLEARRRRDL
jgi:hypothetical protein